MNMAPDAPNLLVPMNVDALAVGADSNSWMLHVPDFATGMNQGNFLGYQQLAGALSGTSDPAAVSVLKLFGSEAVQRASLHAMESHGEDSLVHPAFTAPPTHMMLNAFIASWFERYARSFPGTIAGGTSEIHRNIIAERILGLPR